MRQLFASFTAAIALAAFVAPALSQPKPAGLAAPPSRVLPSGASLASVTHTRLFPRLVGEPMPGWLAAYGNNEMATAYEGYHEEAALPEGRRLLMLRTQGLFGAYVLKGDRCEGELLFEPVDQEYPETLAMRLKRAGFRMRTGLLATRDRAYGVTAAIHERARGAYTEQYVLFDLRRREDGLVRARTVVGAEGYYPTRLAGALAPAISRGTTALVDFCRSEEEKLKISSF